jgi:hypothetical protein
MRELKQKYDQHKYRAERRGIPFELTFKQWLKIWTDSGHLRERGHNSRATRQARNASEIKDDQHWQFGLRVIPPKV